MPRWKCPIGGAPDLSGALFQIDYGMTTDSLRRHIVMEPQEPDARGESPPKSGQAAPLLDNAT
jgi:hypothetical protein